MSQSVLILGESGCGKSTSIRNLVPRETFIINVVNKPLPFKGAFKNYNKLTSDGLEGNYYATDDVTTILRLIKLVNERRPEIRNLIIDDFGYMIMNSFMRKANQKGYDKYSELGAMAFNVLSLMSQLRDDLFCFVMMHTEIDGNGRSKPKTVGKMIDSHVCIEGQFTFVLHALVNDSGYVFLTNNDGQHMAKSPLGMFDELYIENDLQMIRDKIEEYYND